MSETKRTRKEVDQDYSNQALLLGHKSRVLAQVKAEVERLEKEIKGHLDRLLELNQEGVALPAEETPVLTPEVVA
jgi:uncharacterized coiled-coil protein SlyX